MLPIFPFKIAFEWMDCSCNEILFISLQAFVLSQILSILISGRLRFGFVSEILLSNGSNLIFKLSNCGIVFIFYFYWGDRKSVV